MLMAQRDAAGDYVVRYNISIEEVPAIQARNLAVYAAEVERVFKKHGCRCLHCHAVFAPKLDGFFACETCVELMRIYGPYMRRAAEAECAVDLNRAQRVHDELYFTEEEIDDEEEPT